MSTIIGITGGTGGGKTTFLTAIEALGGLVIDCDALYHHILDTDPALTEKLVERYGNVTTDGKIDRKKLGNIVFSDPVALGDLNAIAHEFVSGAVAEILAQNHPLVAIDAIALMESGLGDLCNTTVCITAPEKDRIKRLMLRENISEEYAKKRISAQKTDQQFMQMCQHTLVNDGTYAEFIDKCNRLLQIIYPQKSNSKNT